jgi:hypothetical protein
MEATSNLLAASKIAVSDSRYEIFFVFAGDQGCQSGLELETGLGCCQQLPRKRMHKHLQLPSLIGEHFAARIESANFNPTHISSALLQKRILHISQQPTTIFKLSFVMLG